MSFKDDDDCYYPDHLMTPGPPDNEQDAEGMFGPMSDDNDHYLEALLADDSDPYGCNYHEPGDTFMRYENDPRSNTRPKPVRKTRNKSITTTYKKDAALNIIAVSYKRVVSMGKGTYETESLEAEATVTPEQNAEDVLISLKAWVNEQLGVADDLSEEELAKLQAKVDRAKRRRGW